MKGGIYYPLQDYTSMYSCMLDQEEQFNANFDWDFLKKKTSSIGTQMNSFGTTFSKMF